MMNQKKELLNVKNLKTYFYTHEGIVKAVDAVSFSVNQGETLGIVGESGSGKSVTALSIMRLIPQPPGKIVGGDIIFDGKNLCALTEREMRKIRGSKISMIFQEPMTSLDPVFTIGHEIVETILLHQDLTKKEANKKAVEMLEVVGIPDAHKRMKDYPHELSGGMRQRIMIAMALSCNPTLLIADEPTTALDVPIQAQILELMLSLQDDYGMSIIMITHDLGVIAEMSDRVVVMYAGKVVEYADAVTLFKNPKHPYTWGLLNAIPRLDIEQDTLYNIPGVVPDPLHFPKGCKFNTRCTFCEEKCKQEEHELIEVEKNHYARCFFIEKVEKEKARTKAGENL